LGTPNDSQKKSLVYGKVLVDDWPDYYLPWLGVRPRGLVTVPAHPWNADVYSGRVQITCPCTVCGRGISRYDHAYGVVNTRSARGGSLSQLVSCEDCYADFVDLVRWIKHALIEPGEIDILVTNIMIRSRSSDSPVPPRKIKLDS